MNVFCIVEDAAGYILLQCGNYTRGPDVVQEVSSVLSHIGIRFREGLVCLQCTWGS